VEKVSTTDGILVFGRKAWEHAVVGMVLFAFAAFGAWLAYELGWGYLAIKLVIAFLVLAGAIHIVWRKRCKVLITKDEVVVYAPVGEQRWPILCIQNVDGPDLEDVTIRLLDGGFRRIPVEHFAGREEADRFVLALRSRLISPKTRDSP
jgi:hypothetical protein